MKMYFEKPETVFKIFCNIVKAYGESVAEIKTKHSQWKEFGDTRILIFTFCRETTQSYVLSSIFMRDYLSQSVWWESQKHFKLPDNFGVKYIEDRVYSYSVEMKASFVQSIFVNVEVAIRNFVRNIPNTKYPEATEEFWKIRNYLIEKTEIQKEYKDLLQIYQNIRNSFHNGGFHTIKSEEIIFKEKTYSFKKDSPISFTDWEFLELLSKEINCFLLDIVNSPVISKIEEIVHPYATIEFKRPDEN